MVWSPSLLDAFYLASGLFQFTLVAFLLAGRRVDVERAAIALVLAIAATQAVKFLGELQGFETPYHPTLRYLDTVVLATTAFLLARYPDPMGGQRGKRWSLRLWIGVLAVWLPASHVLYSVSGGREGIYQLLDQIMHEGAFALSAALFAVHLVPRMLDLDPGPLRTETMLVGGGLSSTLAFRAGGWSLKYTKPGFLEHFRNLTTASRTAFQIGVVWFVVAGLVRLLLGMIDKWRTAPSNQQWARTRDPVVLAGLTAFGIASGIIVFDTAINPVETGAQLLRPVLLAAAILRFSMFDLPSRHRRVLVPVALSFFAALAYLQTVFLLPGTSLGSDTISPLGGLLSAGIVGGAAFALRDEIARTIWPDRHGEGEHSERLRRYRIALERHREGSQSVDLEAKREQLGVDDAEHQALVSVLEENVLVPTDLLHGAEPGTRVAGRYEVQRELGQGGQGRALLARDLDDDQLVVLKELLRPWEADAEARRERLHREADAAKRVESEHVASVEATVEDGQRLYLVRQFVPGRTLAEVLTEEGKIEPQRTRNILRDLLAGLTAIHQAGLVYLDLKPENVILDEDGRAVLVDLGTARPDPADEGDTVTMDAESSTSIEGTLAWMAPEQVQGLDVDERSDLFAAGALAYRMLTGEHHVPIQERTRFGVERAIVDGSAPNPYKIGADPDLAAIVARCLARDPEKRPASAKALLQAITVDEPSARS